MKRTLCFTSLVLGLALLLAPARPSSAVETSTVDRLQQQGWDLVSPNVLQRPMGSGKVETIGFGVEGLEFKIAGMKKDLASFKESLRRSPDPQLRRTVQAYRAEIKRLTRNLALMAEAAQVTTKAGIDCTINYGAHADAFPLGNSTQGVAASADSYFNNNCPQHNLQGEVWVTTVSEASNSSGVFTRSSKTDPAAGADAPYTGFDIRAASSTSVAGLAQCFSYAYASLTSYSLGVVYEQRVENRLCSPPNHALAANGTTATASSTYNENRLPVAAINGDRRGLQWGTGDPQTGSGWTDGTVNVYPDWIEVAFNGTKSLTEVSVFSLQDDYPSAAEPDLTMTFTKFGLQDFDIRYWTGSAWATVPGGAVVGNSKVWCKITFPALSTTKIRVLVKRALDRYSRIVEIEAR